MLCKKIFAIAFIAPLVLSAPLHQRGLTEVKRIAVLENAQDPHTISPGPEMTKVDEGWAEAPRLMMAAQKFLNKDQHTVQNSKLYQDFLDRKYLCCVIPLNQPRRADVCVQQICLPSRPCHKVLNLYMM
jgi:hypothetical protein